MLSHVLPSPYLSRSVLFPVSSNDFTLSSITYLTIFSHTSIVSFHLNLSSLPFCCSSPLLLSISFCCRPPNLLQACLFSFSSQLCDPAPCPVCLCPSSSRPFHFRVAARTTKFSCSPSSFSLSCLTSIAVAQILLCHVCRLNKPCSAKIPLLFQSRRFTSHIAY